MSMVRRGRLSVDPVRNPSILDTFTWDEDAAVRIARTDSAAGDPKNAVQTVDLGEHQRLRYSLLLLPDGQRLIRASGRGTPVLGVPAAHQTSPESTSLYPADIETTFRLLRDVAPERGPRALGPIPRLGIGTRHSTLVFPGIWDAMESTEIATNAIQNSLRELALLQDLIDGAGARTNHLFNFGPVPEAHTGSTFEGLLLAGVLFALERGTAVRFGADADHIQVKRGPGGRERALAVVRAARHYTFFTVDISDVLDYAALTDRSRTSSEMFERAVVAPSERAEICRFHGETRAIGRLGYSPDEDRIGRLCAKYSRGLDELEAVVASLRTVRNGVPFDLELAVDETPHGISACDVVTASEEIAFLLLELQRRGIDLTHIAPNLGVEKGTDFRCEGGIPVLRSRVRDAVAVAGELGAIVDCHSGDDLSRATRSAVGEAAGGNIHFKLSPSLQDAFADVLYETERPLYDEWAGRTFSFVQARAQEGHPVAIELLSDRRKSRTIEPNDPLFRKFCFAAVGERSPNGEYPLRADLYACSDRTRAEYRKRITSLVVEASNDVLQSGGGSP